MTAFYLAPRYSRREEMQGYKRDLEARGHVVHGQWINDPYPATEEYILEHPSIAGDLALDDLRDIAKADTLIAFTEHPGSGGANRGGRHVELGIALARDMPVIVIGPRENVFHCLPDIKVYTTWGAYLETVPSVGGTSPVYDSGGKPHG